MFIRSMGGVTRLLVALSFGLVFSQKTDFRCPEEFGYYPHNTDCSLYYVCVFGGPLLESCTGGLVYSADLQTCDWPRNVACNRGKDEKANLIDSDSLNVHIDYKKKVEEPRTQSSREPRRQSQESGEENILVREEARPRPANQRPVAAVTNQRPGDERVTNQRPVVAVTNQRPGDERVTNQRPGDERVTNQRTGVEAEILRNIDLEEPEIIDSLRPQPSILSTVIDGVDRVLSGEKHRHKQESDAVDGKSSFSSKPQFSSGQTYGEKSETEGAESKARDEELSLSDIEKKLLLLYPGESKHLDDSQDHVHDYYTQWDDPIYDEFQDYEYEEVEEVREALEAVKEASETEADIEGEVRIDQRVHSPRQPGEKPGPKAGSSAKRCEREKCQLPDCHCGGDEIPSNLTRSKTPQLVLLTFDDSLNDLNRKLYESIFQSPIRRNPNGCPISATFYVSHEWTDYSHVQNVYSDGHEIASHSISHSFGEQFSVKKWTKEMAGQREILAAYGGVKIDDIRGMRAPFLAIGGNNMYSMMYDANFTYDSSMPIYENKPPSFPYTLDYKIFHDCMIPPCPTKSYPGIWELPLVMWNDLKDGRCSMADACSNPADAEGVYLMILQNFQRHYNTNRAPFGLYYHPAWFTTPHHKEGFELFLDTITEMEDVWLVTSWQTIQWMRNPTSLDKIRDFEPFNCDYKDRPPRCDKPKVCNLWHKSGVRYMRTCQACPSIYPWTGRTGVTNSLVDRL